MEPPNKWTSGSIGLGAVGSSGGAISVYGGGLIGQSGVAAGGSLTGGGFGGGLSAFGQASYNQMPSAGTGSINMETVNGYRGYEKSYYDFGGNASSADGIIEGELLASLEGGYSFYKFPSPKEIMAKYPDPSKAYYDGGYMECAVRMSIALHYNGVDISSSNEFRTTITRNEIIYQRSAKALADWIETQIGVPKIYIHQSGRYQEMDFINKEGIIYFVHPLYGGNGSGHIDVISGGSIGSGFYPNRMIKFWEYSNGSYGN